MLFILILIVLILCILAMCINIVPQGSAYVIERLGKYYTTWNPGINFKVPLIDRVARRVLMKEQVADFAPQPVIIDAAIVATSTIIANFLFIIIASCKLFSIFNLLDHWFH